MITMYYIQSTGGEFVMKLIRLGMMVVLGVVIYRVVMGLNQDTKGTMNKRMGGGM